MKPELEDLFESILDGQMGDVTRQVQYALDAGIEPEVFIESIQTIQPQIVALSALLTTTTPNMKVCIDAMRDAGVLSNLKVMVGGAPVTTEFAQQIGADGYAPNASQAASLARSFIT